MIIDGDAEVSFTRSHRYANASTALDRNLRVDLVAPYVRKTNRVEDVNAVNHPANLRFPINGLENSARGRRCNHIVAHALDLHFRTAKERIVARDFENNS